MTVAKCKTEHAATINGVCTDTKCAKLKKKLEYSKINTNDLFRIFFQAFSSILVHETVKIERNIDDRQSKYR